MGRRSVSPQREDGFGEAQWVPLQSPQEYTIYFENIAGAGAPASRVEIRDPLAAGTESNGSSGGVQVIRSVMAGKVLHVMVSEGDRVSAGDPLLVIEAMKMENEIRSPKDGTVQAIRVSPGETVETNAELAIIE